MAAADTAAVVCMAVVDVAVAAAAAEVEAVVAEVVDVTAHLGGTASTSN